MDKVFGSVYRVIKTHRNWSMVCSFKRDLHWLCATGHIAGGHIAGGHTGLEIGVK